MTDTLDRTMARALAGRHTRRRLLQAALAVGAGAIVLPAFGGSFTAQEATAQEASAAGPLDSDVEILNYALTLELLEATAYREINDARILSGRAATYFRAFGANEQAHVDALTATIRQMGGTPVQPPAAGYNFAAIPRDPAGVVAFFQQFETVGASAYLGAGPFIRDPAILEAALSIHAVEAEHAAALADLVAPGTELFAPEAFATARLPEAVMTIVAPFFRVPGMPNTGGGGGHRGPGGERGRHGGLDVLGILGLGAAAAGIVSRRRSARAAGGTGTSKGRD